MSEGAAGEGEVCVGQDGDDADAVDAVDMWYDLTRLSCCVSSQRDRVVFHIPFAWSSPSSHP